MTQSKLIKNKQTLNKNGFSWCYFNHPETCLQWPSAYPGSKLGCVVAGTGPWSAVSVASSRRKRDRCYTFPVHCSLSRLRPELVSGLQPLPLPTHASSRLLKLSCVSAWILSSAYVVETCQTSVYILYLSVDLKKGLFFHRQNKICCFTWGNCPNKSSWSGKTEGNKSTLVGLHCWRCDEALLLIGRVFKESWHNVTGMILEVLGKPWLAWYDVFLCGGIGGLQRYHSQ